MVVEWRDMIVEGEPVAGAAQERAWVEWIGGVERTSAALERALRRAGVSAGVVERSADRMLQKARRSGAIYYHAGRWRDA